MRRALAAITILVVLPGCAAIQDWHYDTVNCLRSECAWATCTKNPVRIICASDYGRGWKEGYLCVTRGGTGHMPSLPPRRYWSPKYQTPRGQQAIASWNAGFQDGVIAAERRGAGLYHYVHPNGIPQPGPGDSFNSFSPAEVVPTQAPFPGTTEIPPAPPPETLPPNGNRVIEEPSVDGATSRPGLPTVDAAGLSHSQSCSPMVPVIERLPPCSDTAYDPAPPSAGMLCELEAGSSHPNGERNRDR
jgi:hypothetical protein